MDSLQRSSLLLHNQIVDVHTQLGDEMRSMYGDIQQDLQHMRDNVERQIQNTHNPETEALWHRMDELKLASFTWKTRP